MSFRSEATASYGSQYNEGLRNYMLSIFSYMAAAFGITGFVAFFTASSPAIMQAIYGTPLQWLVMFAPMIFVFFFATKIHSMPLSSAKMMLWAFSTIMGLSLAWIFVAFTGLSIAKVFFISSSMFGTMAIYGHTTKRDLTKMGSFLMMGVVGIIIASLINIFLRSAAMDFAVSFLAVIIFTGLTAYDVQKLKDIYFRVSGADGELIAKTSIMGALTLYFDFINIFLSLLHIFGDRR